MTNTVFVFIILIVSPKYSTLCSLFPWVFKYLQYSSPSNLYAQIFFFLIFHSSSFFLMSILSLRKILNATDMALGVDLQYLWPLPRTGVDEILEAPRGPGQCQAGHQLGHGLLLLLQLLPSQEVTALALGKVVLQQASQKAHILGEKVASNGATSQ